jgi:hypothetical protein
MSKPIKKNSTKAQQNAPQPRRSRLAPQVHHQENPGEILHPKSILHPSDHRARPEINFSAEGEPQQDNPANHQRPSLPQLPEDHSDRHKLSLDNYHPHQPEKSRTKVSPQKTHLLDCHPRGLREHHRRRDFHSLSIVKQIKPTSFIRVLSTGEETVDDTLFNGVDLYGCTFVCETSHLPTPTPLQCPRCFQFGHELAETTNKPQMSRMSPSQQVLRQGALLPWSCSCPKLKQAEVTDETPVFPVKIDPPPPLRELSEPVNMETDPKEWETFTSVTRGLVTFLTKTQFDLFPMECVCEPNDNGVYQNYQ